MWAASNPTDLLRGTEALLLLSSARFTTKAQETLALPLISPPKHVELTKHLGSSPSPYFSPIAFEEAGNIGDAGMMLYTSGTTNRPKGVLIPESVMTAQARSLLKAWEYSPQDRLLHVLPLHHIHGTINAILAPLFAGSSVEFLYPFNADAVWRRLAAPFVDDVVQTNGNGVTTNGANGVNGHANTTNGTSSRHPTTKITFFTVVPT
ncbi:hypothetical protein N0V82_009588, partial [Gnomoniopsis sp. IMI 355080]